MNIDEDFAFRILDILRISESHIRDNIHTNQYSPDVDLMEEDRREVEAVIENLQRYMQP